MAKEEIPEMLRSSLDELQTVLSILGANGQSDRDFLTSLPSPKLAEVSLLAEDTVYACFPDHRLQIIVGQQAINGYQPKSAVDIQTEHRVKLEPGTTLLVDKFARLYDEGVHDLNHYFSDANQYGTNTLVSLGSAAFNLRQGGAISVVKSDYPVQRY